jgi:hypothetical protein
VYGAKDGSSLRQTFEERVNRFGPADFFNLKRSVQDLGNEADLAQWLSLLRLSRGDAGLICACYDAMVDRLGEARPFVREGLIGILRRAWELYLPLREQEDVAFNIGNLLAGLGDYASAITLFEFSIAAYGPDAATTANLALCQARLARGASPDEKASEVSS